jgi:hypothetical protein
MHNSHGSTELVKVVALVAGIGLMFIVVLHRLTALIP